MTNNEKTLLKAIRLADLEGKREVLATIEDLLILANALQLSETRIIELTKANQTLTTKLSLCRAEKRPTTYSKLSTYF